MDNPNDTHRHLSHLIGLYPGYAIANYVASNISDPNNAPAPSDVLNAAKVSLIHRGNGTGPDADAGWEKVWRAACWAQLMNPDKFYFELSVRSITVRDHVIPRTNSDTFSSMRYSAITPVTSSVNTRR